MTTEFVSQESARTLGVLDVCVFFALIRFFYPSTSSTAIILSVPILPPREIQALWSLNHDTAIPHCNAVSRVNNAMTREKNEEMKQLKRIMHVPHTGIYIPRLVGRFVTTKQLVSLC